MLSVEARTDPVLEELRREVVVEKDAHETVSDVVR
jgi:hypothetical protein